MLLKREGASFQSPEERGRLDSQSANVLSLPGIKIALREIFFFSHQLAIWRAILQSSLDLHPPSLLI
jgi:hypothetical protein